MCFPPMTMHHYVSLLLLLLRQDIIVPDDDWRRLLKDSVAKSNAEARLHGSFQAQAQAQEAQSKPQPPPSTLRHNPQPVTTGMKRNH